MERISPIAKAGERKEGERKRRESNKAAGACGFLRGKLLYAVVLAKSRLITTLPPPRLRERARRRFAGLTLPLKDFTVKFPVGVDYLKLLLLYRRDIARFPSGKGDSDNYYRTYVA